MERLTKELWFRGIGQWRSGLGGICSAVLGVPAERRRAEGRRNENGAASALGQALGGFKAWLRRQEVHGAWPARSAGRRRAAHTRPALSEPGRPRRLNDF